MFQKTCVHVDRYRGPVLSNRSQRLNFQFAVAVHSAIVVHNSITVQPEIFSQFQFPERNIRLGIFLIIFILFHSHFFLFPYFSSVFGETVILCSVYSFSSSCLKTVSRTRKVFPTGSTTLLRLQLSRTRDCAHRSRHVGLFLFFFLLERKVPAQSKLKE